ncbi:hypothetical protein PS662_03325 [Pseudomonas fluorescens]|uniref:Lipoprotein n=1 Tax=Pseudomonas fluorescens TaxID=294 RepID=A0A5E6U688_PSEFL|nr:hypothetical protein [Pseudomonas fluorescens]VVN00591.1 hypothetical protein PS662_03325 [Pseudomonas fluorescens]
MNRLTIAALSAVLLAYVGHASAELKKLRDWPAALEAPSPEIRKQYEYDPEAGAATSKLLSSTSRIFKDGAEVNTQITNYRNSTPVSGTGSWNTLLPAYHGFSAFFTSPMKTTKLKYSSSGPWPASEFKIFSENINPQGVGKSATACKQVKNLKADRYLATLPGNIYTYECLMKYGGTSGDFTYAPDALSLINMYSDYLGIVISSFYIDPSVTPGLRVRGEYKFVDVNGKEQIVVTEDADMRSKFSQL